MWDFEVQIKTSQASMWIQYTEGEVKKKSLQEKNFFPKEKNYDNNIMCNFKSKAWKNGMYITLLYSYLLKVNVLFSIREK